MRSFILGRLMMILVFIFLGVEVCLARADAPDLHIHMLAGVELDGHEYTVAILRPSTSGSILEKSEKDFAASLMKRSQDWIQSQYAERYRRIDPVFFTKMFQENPLNDGRSSVILIGRGRDLWNIEATLRVSSPKTPSERTPSEKFFDIDLPRPKLEMGLHTPGEKVWSESGVSATKRLQVVGSTKELKNLVIKKDLETDLMPLLFFIAERAWISDEPVNYNLEDVSQYIGRELVGPAKMKVAVYPTQYELSADQVTARIYRDWGWLKTDVQPRDGANVSMQISREEYLGTMLEKIRSRPGIQGILTNGKFKDYRSKLKGSEGKSLAAFFSVPECAFLFKADPYGAIRFGDLGLPTMQFPPGMGVEIRVKKRGL